MQIYSRTKAMFIAHTAIACARGSGNESKYKPVQHGRKPGIDCIQLPIWLGGLSDVFRNK